MSAKALDVGGIHLIEICHIDEEDRRLYDVGKYGTGPFEQRLEIRDRLTQLRGEVVGKLTVLKAELTRTDDPVAGAHDRLVWTYRRGWRGPRGRSVGNRFS